MKSTDPAVLARRALYASIALLAVAVLVAAFQIYCMVRP